mgnify:CR=1 FL=1
MNNKTPRHGHISFSLAWQPPDCKESKVTVRSHTAGHTIFQIYDELHHHKEASMVPPE